MKYVPPGPDELKRRGIDPKTMQPITKTATTQTPKPAQKRKKTAASKQGK